MSETKVGAARELGIVPGILETGPCNAITDIQGVRVGQVTWVKGEDVRTGATAILPHRANLYQEKVPAGLSVGNGYGKLMGATQLVELGEIETPILLTNTLSVPNAASAILEWTLSQPDNVGVRSINPIVGETNDGTLNAIERRVLTVDAMLAAMRLASSDRPEEGNVGAGTGTTAFGWKGGIGTSSRTLPEQLGGYSLGALVQSNYGGVLQILGVPIGELLGQHYLKDQLGDASADGSIMIVLATDAPLSDRNLSRLAWRSFAGLARTGSSYVNGSGDYAIAFSTSEAVRRTPVRREACASIQELPNELMSPLFQAVIEATEEAIYNSLFAAETMSGRDGVTIKALPRKRVLDLLRKRGVVT